MSIIKIKDIILCTGLYEDNNENRKTYDFLTEQGIAFQHNAYWHPDQHAELWANYNTWVPDMNLNSFPFIHYTEVHDDYSTKPVFLIGYNQIVNSNLAQLSKL
jgi:hypothetical protein